MRCRYSSPGEATEKPHKRLFCCKAGREVYPERAERVEGSPGEATLSWPWSEDQHQHMRGEPRRRSYPLAYMLPALVICYVVNS